MFLPDVLFARILHVHTLYTGFAADDSADHDVTRIGLQNLQSGEHVLHKPTGPTAAASATDTCSTKPDDRWKYSSKATAGHDRPEPSD